jgi:hypothetical protein
VYAKELQSAPQPLVASEILQAYNLYRPSKTAMDATGVGMTFVDDLVREYELENVIQFVFSAPSKLDLMTRLQGAIYRREFIMPFCQETRTLIDQLSFYKLDDKKIKNDHPIALALTNLAREDFLRDGLIYSEIDPGLMVTPVWNGGQSIPSDLLYGNDDFLPDNGVAFTVDPKTGLFVPMM